MTSIISDDFRIELARRVANTLGLGVYVFGAATGLPYPRFLGLRSAAERALWRSDLDDAEALAGELLSLSERYRSDWFYGNAVHHAHIILGRVELQRNHLGPAVRHLHGAGETPGSPQLNSFGPSMVLAKELLELGEREAVLEYFDLCESFWKASASYVTRGRRHPLEEWREQVQAGEIPDFKGNLVY